MLFNEQKSQAVPFMATNSLFGDLETFLIKNATPSSCSGCFSFFFRPSQAELHQQLQVTEFLTTVEKLKQQSNSDQLPALINLIDETAKKHKSGLLHDLLAKVQEVEEYRICRAKKTSQVSYVVSDMG